MEQINREEITKTSKWARLVYMLIFGLIFNFSIIFLFGFALIQFVFYLFTGNVNENLSRVCFWLTKFYDQIVSYLLFQTDLPPFPFTDIDGESSPDEIVVDSETEEEILTEEKEETS
tara:strand:+ start:363 stop:713 length:351 start_codon:yes stop_codon:yes gene_type:complete